jgi:hypothetical protein
MLNGNKIIPILIIIRLVKTPTLNELPYKIKYVTMKILMKTYTNMKSLERYAIRLMSNNETN